MVKKRSRTTLKRTITHWHRRLGIISALIVMLISFSGILLNHSDQLGLPAKGVKFPLLLSLYHVELPALRAFSSGEVTVSQLGESLYLGREAIDPCHGSLVGAVYIANLHYIACSETLAIYTNDRQLVERLEPAHGLPHPLDELGSSGGVLVVRATGQKFVADVDVLEWRTGITDSKVLWSQAVDPDDNLEKALRAHYRSDISWERVLLDFHAGRFLGALGPLVLDAFAVCFIILALSGSWLWFKGRKAR